MKFLTLLILLLLQRLPCHPLHTTLDRGYRAFHRWSARLWKSHLGAVAPFLTSLLTGILLVWMLFWWLEGWLGGVPTLLAYIVLLYLSLGRGQEQRWIQRYMIAWHQGDHASAQHYAEELLGRHCTQEDSATLHTRVIARLIYMAFDRLFMVIFWFLLLGPLGAVLVRLSERALDHARQTGHELDPSLVRFERLLEWPAARLLGLTFALAGKPLLGIRQWAADLLHPNMETERFLNRQWLTGCGYLSHASSCYQQRPEMITAEAQQEFELLKEQLWRALIIWVAGFALTIILLI